MPGYAKEILRKYKKGGKVDKKKKDYSYAEGGKVEVTPEAKKIPKELEKASKMHKSQAERLKGMGFKDGGEMKYGHGGEAKPDFLDMDKDGNKTEPMKKAVKDKEEKEKK